MMDVTNYSDTRILLPLWEWAHNVTSGVYIVLWILKGSALCMKEMLAVV